MSNRKLVNWLTWTSLSSRLVQLSSISNSVRSTTNCSPLVVRTVVFVCGRFLLMAWPDSRPTLPSLTQISSITTTRSSPSTSILLSAISSYQRAVIWPPKFGIWTRTLMSSLFVYVLNFFSLFTAITNSALLGLHWYYHFRYLELQR